MRGLPDGCAPLQHPIVPHKAGVAALGALHSSAVSNRSGAPLDDCLAVSRSGRRTVPLPDRAIQTQEGLTGQGDAEDQCLAVRHGSGPGPFSLDGLWVGGRYLPQYWRLVPPRR